MKTIYIALGSNVGDRAANLRDACTRLETDVDILRRSSLYDTAPRGLLNQPWFLNQVIEAETELLPRQSMKLLLRIEREMGRKRTVRNGPRLIDLDLLLYASAVIDAKGLLVPHPRMGERRFVLEPLAEIAPDLRHPVTGQSIKQMLASVMDQQVRCVD